ncbi:MAG TPA: antibiotic biosynthesis monooxygenase [Anaerolineae bacterium]|nr:antibiotic biosynthesis monooxygenase [Anaerolineae bacterium]
MVMTILETHVSSERWSELERIFGEETKQLDPGIVQTFLLHSSSDPTLWRIATVWESRKVLAAMRQSVATPRGVLMFRKVGAEPVLSVFDIVSPKT